MSGAEGHFLTASSRMNVSVLVIVAHRSHRTEG